MADAEKAPAPAVTRAIAILDVLQDAEGAPLTLTDLARAVGTAKSSMSNLCQALEEGGLIERFGQGYRLGRHLAELGGAYVRQFDEVREFYRLCDESAVLTGRLVQLAVLHEHEVLYIARHEGGEHVRLTATIGDRMPASITALGNALLALLPDAEIRRRLHDAKTRPAFTDRSVTTIDGVLKKVHETRERGYAIDDGEVFPHVYGIATTITRADGPPIGIGSSVYVSAARDGAPAEDAVVAELHRLADRLTSPLLA